MKYIIEFVENKNKDWKIATVKSEQGATWEDVSINRVGKKGDVFENFDDIQAGREVYGELWTSTAGKNYLFPPRNAHKSSYTPRRGTGAVKVEEIRRESIKEAQERKNESIAFFNATNSAIEIVSKFNVNDLTEDEIKGHIVKWREFFLSEWEKYESKDYTDKHKPF